MRIWPRRRPRRKPPAAPPATPPVATATPPVAATGERWNLWVTTAGFAVILGALALVAVVGMRVSWVPLRDTADTIGLSEVRQYYPLVIDLLDGLAIVASIALYGTPGYRWAIGTVIGLTAISLTLNVAHGSAAGRVTGMSDATTWGHVILASAAPTICIGLGAHLAALTWGRVAGAVAALRAATQGATPPVAAPAAVPAEPVRERVEVRRLNWADAIPRNARLLPLVPAATPLRELTDGRDTGRGEHLTTAEVAARRGVDPSTVRSWVTRGRLRPVATDPANGSHLFDAAAVAALN